MRWLTFIILLLVVLVVQSSVAPHLALLGARPDFVLVIVAFFALYARPWDAVLAAWVLGACADLMTVERLGFLALSYSLAAVLIISIREYLFRYRAATHFVLVLGVALLLRMAWAVYAGILYDRAGSWGGAIGRDWLLVALYTACWAPLIDRLLLSASATFGIARPRYSFAGLHKLRGGHV